MSRTRDMLCRLEVAGLRKCDEDKRTATYTAATERAVDMGWTKEVLRMHGVRLARFRKNPVFLDSHNYDSAGAVVGSAKIKQQGRELVAEVTYANTARAEEIWQLVRDGHLRAVSIGYSFDRKDVRRIAEGEFDGEGDARVEGPAEIVRKWELLELSQVSVPADEDAIRRSFYQQESEMGIEYSQLPVETPAEPDKPADPAPVAAVREAKEQAAPKGKVIKLPEEIRARLAVARRDEVLARTPSRLHRFAEDLLADDGLDADAICKRVREEIARTHEPVGSSEPEPPEPPKKNEWDESSIQGLRTMLTGKE